MKDLKELLPFLEIDDNGCIVSKSGQYTLVYELTKAPLGTLSEALLEITHQAWVKAISLLFPGIALHLMDWYNSAVYTAGSGNSSENSFLGDCSDRFFYERPYRDHRAYLCITYIADVVPVTSAFSALLRPSLAPQHLLDPTRVQEFIQLCGQFVKVLCESRLIQTRQLNKEELAGTTTHTGLIQQYHQLTAPFMPPELRDLSAGKDLRIGNQEVAIYSVVDADQLPASCSSSMAYDRYSTDRTRFPVGFAAALGPLLDADHIYNQVVFVVDPQKELKRLEQRFRRLKSLSAQDRTNAVACEALQAYLNEAAAGSKRIVRLHLNVILWANAPDKLQDAKNKLVAAMTKSGILPHLETVGAPLIWWGSQPGNVAELSMNDTFNTFSEQAACFFIHESNERNSISPFGIRLGDRHSGLPLHVDISDEPMQKRLISNRAKFVLGPSGSGKSVFCLHLLRCYYEQGAHIVVVDIGGSYKGLCQLLGGRYFTYEQANLLRLNPFLLLKEETLDVEALESIKALFLVIWKKRDEPFMRSEYVVLSNMVKGYRDYLGQHTTVFPCFDTFYEWLKEHFVHQLATENVSDKNFDLNNFLYVLRPYYRGGEYDYLLNAREEMDLLNERLIIFDLDVIRDHPILLPIATIVIMDIFIRKMRTLKGVRKVILLEEAWKALARDVMSEYIRYLYKTVRKFFGEPIVVTQEIEDILSSPVVKNTIINMSDCKILLDISKYAERLNEIADLIGLTEMDKILASSLNRANEAGKNYKEVLISLGNNYSRVYRVELSLEEYLVFTTEESEKLKVQNYTSRYGSIRQGVAALAADIRAGLVQLSLVLAFTASFLLVPGGRASAQLLDLIGAAVKKVLVTADLQVQRLQTQTLVLQNVQKDLENTMQKGLLGDIRDWVQQQDELYKNYYQQLWQVKSALATYSKVRSLIQRQEQLVRAFVQAKSAIRQDPHFSAGELAYISGVYDGLLNETVANTAQLTLVMGNFLTQMDDAARLRTIDETASRIDRNYGALQSFGRQTALISLQRSRDAHEIHTIQGLYGIQ